MTMIEATQLAEQALFGLPLATLWFVLVFAMLGTFLFLDGFDFGAGAVFATQADATARETILAAIGPFWDGNEVWLVVFGGALFAAFPAVYAGLFSRHYLLLFGVLGALILRGLAPEMYEQRHDQRWQRWWGRAFVVGSLAAPFLLGAFVGEWLAGTGGSLSLVGVLAGLTVTALTVVSGVAFLRLKAAAILGPDVQRLGERALGSYLASVVALLAALYWRVPRLHPALESVPVVALVGGSVLLAGGYVGLLRRERHLLALLASGGLTYGLTAVVALLLYPTLDPATGLRVEDAIVSTLPLNLMTIGASLLLPLVVVYFIVLYTAFRGPVDQPDHYSP
jgi:cytochrome d ubiquinol oxidase subunit II